MGQHRSRVARSGGLGVKAPYGQGGVSGRGVPRENEIGFSSVRETEREIRRLVGCVLCGRAGGQLRAGAALCEQCRRRYGPTELQLGLDELGLSVRGLAELAGVSVRTVLRAARGDRVSREAARALERVTGIRVVGSEEAA